MEKMTRTSMVAGLEVMPALPQPGLSRGEVVDKILTFCGLQEKLSQSACLRCEMATLAMSNRPAATLYCSALFRDLDVCITDCTSFTPV